ncbi:MAG: phosphoglucomutase/phosphomannomutase family protein, partial [Anaerolineales bacterium]|nr:phosphoglucomutase/phosphomannomutase family protein [Anaerolineales bacterium]
MTIKFGTDGWRAVISEDFTFDNVRKVAQAIADHTLSAAQPQANGTQPSLVVGYDTRFLSDRYAHAVAEVLAANGIHVWLTRGDAPTPLVSYAIVDKQAAGGVMITASHNPPRYNGIKLKASYGGGTTASETKAVEQRVADNDTAGVVPKRLPLAQAVEQDMVTLFDPLLAYR